MSSSLRSCKGGGIILFDCLSHLCAIVFLFLFLIRMTRWFGLVLGFLVRLLHRQVYVQTSGTCSFSCFSLIWAKLRTQTRNSPGSSLKWKEEERSAAKALRRKLSRERKKRKEAMSELHREREASAWASEEAMAKIMSLESEKARLEREARHYRQMMETKQLHDEELIHHLHHHHHHLLLLLVQQQSTTSTSTTCNM